MHLPFLNHLKLPSMYLKLNSVIFFLVITGCKVSESKIIGKYLDKERNDTLTIKSDNTYEFEQQLNTAAHGWNTGSWKLEKNSVSFSNTAPLAEVGCKLRITKKGTGEEPLQLNFILDKSQKNLAISDVVILNSHVPVNRSEFNIISNRVVVKTANFDSLAVKFAYFPFITFNKQKFDKNGIYEIVVYPAERLYELDKLSYKYRNGSLINRSESIKYKRI